MSRRAFRHYPRLATAVLVFLLVGFVFVIVGPAKIPKDVFRVLMFVANVIGVYTVVVIGRMLY